MKTIICHPDNLKLIQKMFPPNIYGHDYSFAGMYGFDIRTDVHIPRFRDRWEFPQTPFVEYEKSDETWAIPLKFGKWVQSDEPVFFEITEPNFLNWGNQ